MAGRGRTSFQKRQKEQVRAERRQAKAARKEARKANKGVTPEDDIENPEPFDPEADEQSEDQPNDSQSE